MILLILVQTMIILELRWKNYLKKVLGSDLFPKRDDDLVLGQSRTICYKHYMAISNKAKLLVDTIVAKGCTITEASKLAGYKGNSSRVSASRMLHKPEVQAYMVQQVQARIAMGSTKAINQIINLSGGANSEYVRLEASKDILDRAGYKAPDKHQHLLDGNFSIKIDLS